MSIIKTVTADEAKQYDCCVHERKCTGTLCMAWVEAEKYVGEDHSMKAHPMMPGISKYEKSDKGYCGLVEV